jgi:hypothetical protein
MLLQAAWFDIGVAGFLGLLIGSFIIAFANPTIAGNGSIFNNRNNLR